jgi:transcriptional regulator with XRE-family HTH domain
LSTGAVPFLHDGGNSNARELNAGSNGAIRARHISAREAARTTIALTVDDQRVGALLRVLRVRRGLRQIDIARLAGVSDQTVSRIERGQLDALSVGAVRRVVRALEARLDLSVWTRAGDIERVASARHADLVESVIALLTELGWTARPEVSFNLHGERGLIDILAWHPATRTLLLVEVKTEVVDVGEVVGTLDRKRRLASTLAAQAGWSPLAFGTAPVVADTTTNHRRVREHANTFRAALPDSGQRFRAFIRRPRGPLAAVAFWSIRHPGSVRRPLATVRRVRRVPTSVNRADPRSRDLAPTILRNESRARDPDRCV